MKNAILAFLVIFISSCTFVPQQVTITSPTQEKFAKLNLTVVDKRENKLLIGKRSLIGANITAKDPSQFPEIFKKKILTKLEVIERNNLNTEVIIKDIGYKIIDPYVSSWCKMELTVRDNSQKILFTNKYKSYINKDWLFMRSMEQNEEQINEAIDAAVEKIVSDNALLEMVGAKRINN